MRIVVRTSEQTRRTLNDAPPHTVRTNGTNRDVVLVDVVRLVEGDHLREVRLFDACWCFEAVHVDGACGRSLRGCGLIGRRLEKT